jgi:hypothetical protein
MEVITFESDAFKQLEKKIDRIAGFVTNIETTPKNKDPDWKDIRCISSNILCIISNIFNLNIR